MKVTSCSENRDSCYTYIVIVNPQLVFTAVRDLSWLLVMVCCPIDSLGFSQSYYPLSCCLYWLQSMSEMDVTPSLICSVHDLHTESSFHQFVICLHEKCWLFDKIHTVTLLSVILLVLTWYHGFFIIKRFLILSCQCLQWFYSWPMTYVWYKTLQVASDLRWTCI